MTDQPVAQLKLREEALKAYEGGDFIRAADLYLAVEKFLQDNGEIAQAAEIANNRSVALQRAGNPLAALDAATRTDEIFAQMGDLKRQAMALGNQAAALADLKRTDEALARYHRSAELFQQCGEKSLQSLVLKRIATIRFEKKDILGALSSMLDALNLQERLSPQERFLKWLLRLASRLSR